MKFIRLITCENPVEANILEGKLESEGIRCFLTHENFSNLMPHFTGILGAGVQVMIEEKDYEQAKKWIKTNSQNTTVCPHCNSKNIKTTLGEDKIKKVITILFSMLLAMPFNNIKSISVCADCKTEF